MNKICLCIFLFYCSAASASELFCKYDFKGYLKIFPENFLSIDTTKSKIKMGSAQNWNYETIARTKKTGKFGFYEWKIDQMRLSGRVDQMCYKIRENLISKDLEIYYQYRCSGKFWGGEISCR